MIMGPRVREALEEIYRAFGSQPKPLEIDACPCCVDDKERCTLLSTPLREIGADRLSGYASSAFLTAGGEADFRYFLPRIFDICLNTWSWWPDLEVVLGKLPLANWLRWSPHEVDVLYRLFEAGFDEAIEASSSDGPYREVDSWICGLALAGVDVRPFLAKLEAPAAANALVRFFEMNVAVLPKSKLRNAFWADHQSQAAQVVTWLNSSSVQTIIWRYYESSHDG